VVVDVAAGAEALTARGLRRRRRPHRPAVDPVLDRDRSEAALRDHLDRLRIAVGDAEPEVAQRIARLLRIEARGLEIERLHRRAHGIRRVRRRACEPHREREVLLELRLHERLVVGEHEAAAVAPLGQLRRPAQRPRLRIRVVVRRAVCRVEVGPDARVVALHGRVRIRAGVLDEQRVVERRRLHLPPVGVQQQRPVRVVGDEELELHPVDQRLVRLDLRLGGGRRAAIGVARRFGRGALVVVIPALVVVAVEVDAVAVRDRAVAVVVAQVLAPQTLGAERVLVAVRVRHRHEPELARVEEVRDLRVAAVVLDEVPKQPPRHLRRDPLARVDRAHVERRRPRAVRELPGVLGHLQRDDLAALERPADHLQLHDRRVALRERVELVADAAGLVVGAIDLIAGRRHRVGLLADRLATPVSLQAHVDAARAQPFSLLCGQDQVDPIAAAQVRFRDVVAATLDHGERLGNRLRRVHVQAVPARGLRACRGRERHDKRSKTER
jgi:hypothetical protein